MGIKASRVWSWLGYKRQVKVIMMGLDATGKTTALYKLKLGISEAITTIPTIGFNTESIVFETISFNVWDVGGGDKLFPLFRHYFDKDIDMAMIFIVDSTDRERMPEAKERLTSVLREWDVMWDRSFLILANKQDLDGAMDVEEITLALGLRDFKHHEGRWHVQPTIASNGSGLWEGLEWLAKEIQSKYS